MKLIRKSRTALRMGPGPKCAHSSTFVIFFIREHTANSPNSERAFSMARMRATPITYPRGIFLTLTDAPAPLAAGLGQLSSVRWQRWSQRYGRRACISDVRRVRRSRRCYRDSSIICKIRRTARKWHRKGRDTRVFTARCGWQWDGPEDE